MFSSGMDSPADRDYFHDLNVKELRRRLATETDRANANESRAKRAQLDLRRAQRAYDALAKLIGIDITEQGDLDPCFNSARKYTASMLVSASLRARTDRMDLLELVGETLSRALMHSVVNGTPDDDEIHPVPQPISIQRFWTEEEHQRFFASYAGCECVCGRCCNHQPIR